MIRSYAKINIALFVNEKRSDGFHNIDSFFHLVNFYDEIDFAISESERTEVKIIRSVPYLDEGKTDLMEKAALLFSSASKKNFILEISIKKNIPFKAGLGGGSSNASAVLRYLNAHYDNILSSDTLMHLALLTGSDVPFFLSGFKAAHVKGRGEIIKEVEPLMCSVDLFFPRFSVDTAGAYRILDEIKREKKEIESDEIILSNKLTNDFELVVREKKEIAELRKCYEFFSLSGSGSTYYGINRQKQVSQYNNIDRLTRFLLF